MRRLARYALALVAVPLLLVGWVVHAWPCFVLEDRWEGGPIRFVRDLLEEIR